jgi:hypothetical protein
VVNLYATKNIARGTRIKTPYGSLYTRMLRTGGACAGAEEGIEEASEEGSEEASEEGSKEGSEGAEGANGGGEVGVSNPVMERQGHCDQCGRTFANKNKMWYHYTLFQGGGVKCVRP